MVSPGVVELVWLMVLVPASVLVLETVVEVTVVAGVVVSPGIVELDWLTVLVPASVLVLEPVVEVTIEPGVVVSPGVVGTCLAYVARARLRARTGASS